ncbi:energy-coupling factor ABC transporter ATP-binding protein [Tianweitania sediminis]|uniref:ABC transporter ATP-binding protein n=1 Tax=Tianweitania sediminis TaxID=1502156 RepID=A0A8J7QXX3_9HYPH|nr:ABC transporter ATP-binding protein [Tianweitania sediminis]MBP0437297.1 ABC transporter ATP-binding protein [Tianweitania sediminis]HEV7416097.1 ABC transporter ATP-binding protein [Tianweitania sediminis]
MDLVFSGCSVRYGERVALHPLDLRVQAHRVGVIGLNGSGKTTFARLINGLTLPSLGRVVVNGIDTRAEPDRVRGEAGYVFQNPQNQLIMPVVADDIRFGLKARGATTAEAEQRTASVLARFGIAELAQRRVHELSGGELQLAAMASVCALSPSILVLDEPTNQLDLSNRRLVIKAIETMAEDALVVTHDLEFAARLPRLLLFHEGRLVADGAPGETIARYREIAGC